MSRAQDGGDMSELPSDFDQTRATDNQNPSLSSSWSPRAKEHTKVKAGEILKEFAKKEVRLVQDIWTELGELSHSFTPQHFNIIEMLLKTFRDERTAASNVLECREWKLLAPRHLHQQMVRVDYFWQICGSSQFVLIPYFQIHREPERLLFPHCRNGKDTSV